MKVIDDKEKIKRLKDRIKRLMDRIKELQEYKDNNEMVPYKWRR